MRSGPFVTLPLRSVILLVPLTDFGDVENAARHLSDVRRYAYSIKDADLPQSPRIVFYGFAVVTCGQSGIVRSPAFLDTFGNFVESFPVGHDLEQGSRPKLTRTSLGLTLEMLSSQAIVTFDGRTASEAIPQTYVSGALALEVIGEEDGRAATTRQSNEFWELQGKLNLTCAPLPAYESACDMLGLDHYNPTFPGNSEIFLKPW